VANLSEEGVSTEARDVRIRRMEPADLPAALAIQAEAYPPFLREGEAAFASRITLPASYCLTATMEDRLIAYLLAHGWRGGDPPPVGAVLTPGPTEILFLHDLAVSAAGRGSGIGQRLVSRAFELAVRDGLRRAELIAVEGAAPYWARLGFGQEQASAELARKVAGYGPSARWMTRSLPGVEAPAGTAG